MFLCLHIEAMVMDAFRNKLQKLEDALLKHMLTSADLAYRGDMDHRGDRGDRGEMHDMGDMGDRMI